MPFEKIFKQIDEVIKTHRDIRRDLICPSVFQSYSPAAVSEAFCTVKLDFGRRSGKTSYINSRATSKDLIIVDKVRSVGIYSSSNADVFSIRQVLYSVIYGHEEYENIYIENPSSVFLKGYEEAMYRLFINPNFNHTFIFLG